MNFKEADKLMRRGVAVCHPGMSPGWSWVMSDPGPSYWAINPHTGAWVGFELSEADKARKDWRELKAKK